MAPQDTARHRADPADPGGEEDPGRHRRHPPRHRATSSWWSAPTTAPTARRRASSSATKLGGKGKVVDAPGRPGLDQRPGPHRGVQRVHEEELPRHHGLRRGHRLEGRRRRAKLQTRLTAHPDIKGLHAVQLRVPAATLQLLKQKGLLARRATRSTSSSSPTTASRRSSRTSAGQDRRHRLPAGRPVRQVRALLPQGRDRRARPSSPARPTTTAPSSRSATAAGGPAPAPLVTADGGTVRRRAQLKVDDKSLWGNNARARAHGTGRHRPAAATAPGRRRRGASASRKRFGSTVALRRRHHRRARRDPRPRRPQRRRQVHARLASSPDCSRPTRAPVTFDGEPAPRLRRPGRLARKVACVYQKSTIIPDADRRREPLPQPARPRRGRLDQLAAAAPAAPRSCSPLVGRRRRPTARRGDLDRRAAAVRRDRPGPVLRRPVHHPRRADRPARRRGIDRLFDRMRDLQEPGRRPSCSSATTCRRSTRSATPSPSSATPATSSPRRSPSSPPGELVAAMTGEAVGLTCAQARDGRGRHRSAVPVLRVEGLALPGEFERRSTSRSRAGEVVGLAGAAGSGKTEVAETIVGLRERRRRDRSTVDGRRRPGSVPARARRRGRLVPQDRHHQGLVPACRSRRTPR